MSIDRLDDRASGRRTGPADDSGCRGGGHREPTESCEFMMASTGQADGDVHQAASEHQDWFTAAAV